MKHIPSLLTTVAIATMIASLTFAQVDDGNSRVNGIVVNGNTTTVFEGANDSDLDIGLLKRWSRFAQQHAKIAQQVGDKPTLGDDAGYPAEASRTGEAVRGQS